MMTAMSSGWAARPVWSTTHCIWSSPTWRRKSGKIGVSTGGVFALQTGYKFDDNLRLEVESSYSWHDISKIGGFTGAGTVLIESAGAAFTACAATIPCITPRAECMARSGR